MKKWINACKHATDRHAQPTPPAIAADVVRAPKKRSTGRIDLFGLCANERPALAAPAGEQLVTMSLFVPPVIEPFKKVGRPSVALLDAIRGYAHAPRQDPVLDRLARPRAAERIVDKLRAPDVQIASLCFAPPKLFLPWPLESYLTSASDADTSSLRGKKQYGRIHATLVRAALSPLVKEVESIQSTLKACDAPDSKRQELRDILHSTASCLLHLDRMARRTLEHTLAARIDAVDLVAMEDANRDDETPMVTSVRSLIAEKSSEPSGNGAEFALAITLPRPLEIARTKTSAVTKIVQSNSTFGYVLRRGTKYLIIVGETLTALGAVSRTTAECLKAMRIRNTAITSAANRFTFKTRSSVLDKAASNRRAERSIRDDMIKSSMCTTGWSKVDHDCETHRDATSMAKATDLLSSDITGMIRLSLSIQLQPEMAKFRSCLRWEIITRIKLMRGQPPSDAIQFRKHVLNLFFSRGPNVAARRVILASALTGDWRNRRDVEVYVDHMYNLGGGDVKSIGEAVADSAVAGFLGRMFTTYNRSKWIGWDLSVDELAAMEACSGLLSHTYHRYVASFAKGFSHIAYTATRRHDEDSRSCAKLLAVGDADAERGAMHEQKDTTEAAQAQNHAVIAAKDRRMASLWVHSRPFGRMVLLRQGLEPFREMMDARLHYSSGTWEIEQRCKAAAACLANGSSDCAFSHRDFPALVSARNQLEKVFFTKLRMLFHEPELWRLVPTCDLTAECRCLGFRLLSRIGCAVEELLAHPHRQCPELTYTILDPNGDEVLNKILRMPPCRLDQWTSDLIAMCRDAKLSPKDCKAIVVLHVLLTIMNIVKLECGNAGIRRFLKARSVQTHPLSFEDLVSEFVCQRYRKRVEAQSSFTGGSSPTRKRKASTLESEDAYPAGRPIWPTMVAHTLAMRSGPIWLLLRLVWLFHLKSRSLWIGRGSRSTCPMDAK
jgi:hypothetical protein